MSKIKRWLDQRRVVWAEPALPKYVKINPLSPPGAAEGVQPGDFSMLKIAEEFLEKDEEFGEAPDEGLALAQESLREPGDERDGVRQVTIRSGERIETLEAGQRVQYLDRLLGVGSGPRGQAVG